MQALAVLSDAASAAHLRIQEDFADLNPVISVRRSMRASGVPADAMTIDCLKSNKRILLILHDAQADIVNYQFSYSNQDPEEQYLQIALKELDSDTLYAWIKGYFRDNESL